VVDFLAIHPFSDGNGRTARLLSTYLLERAGYHFARFYSLDTIILERQQAYYKALFDSQREWYKESEDLTPWVEFYLNAIFTQWLRAHEAIRLNSDSRGGNALGGQVPRL
jgi:Fic family protein